MTKEEIRKIMLSVYQGVGNHGSFLRALAETTTRADGENFEILLPALEYIIGKYHLDKKEYLENN